VFWRFRPEGVHRWRVQVGAIPSRRPYCGAVELVERNEPLSALSTWLREAADGAGRLVLVSGEAGVGKTSLVRAFCDLHENDARVWWGACDALSTPRPLGPLYDIARVARGRCATLMDGDVSRHERFAGFLDAVAWPLQPTITVFEDVHWADEATRDLLVFVARRIADVNALVVVTFRDDEVGPEHPLRQVLGHLATLPAVERVLLAPLSAAAVEELAAGRADARQVHRVTGGNPFFVTEVLASGDGLVPPTVADAVSARAARLSDAARQVLEVAAVVPDRVEVELLQQVSEQDVWVVEEGLTSGVLVPAGTGWVRFRHELARLALEASIPQPRRPALHGQVLDWLRECAGVAAARLAFHADEAGDGMAVLEHAPIAAAHAARLGAHREAARLYERALQHAHRLDPADRADLLVHYAREAMPIGDQEASLAAIEQALAIREDLGDVEEIALLESRRAALYNNLSRADDAWRCTNRALALVRSRRPSASKAEVLWRASHQSMSRRECRVAVELATAAIEVSDGLGDAEARAFALNALGVARLFIAPEQAEGPMLEALELAREHGNERLVGQVYMNLGSGGGEVRRYAATERWLREGIAWHDGHDMDLGRGYLVAWLARSLFEQGRWSEAAALLPEVAASTVPMTRVTARNVLARLRIRRGESGGEEPLADVWRLIADQGMMQWQWPVAASRAEAAWLAGRIGEIPGLVQPVYEQALGRDQAWAIGELGFWLWRAGQLQESPEGAAEPFALQIGGEWRAAAAAWEQIGCPYEVAVALADGDDPPELKRALRILGELGAAPMADRVAARLRKMGVHELPRRPSRVTVDNPGGLTTRQLEVLALLVDGRTNAQIAAALHISPKTAGHHVSAILQRLDVADRREAARVARERGLLQP
jgi:DNA-binding CsgD family transcriptional regulator/tetratricopeptide (TPR) repeat protein